MLSMAEANAELLNYEQNPNNIYFMIKLKTFPNYFDGFADMLGTMESVRGFIKSWKDFDKNKKGDNPALERYMIEFVNQILGLPYRYSEAQRLKDLQELK